MTKLLDQAIELTRSLPPEAQDDIARVVFRLASKDDMSPVELSAEEKAAIARSKTAATRGQFASEEEVSTVWSKHGL